MLKADYETFSSALKYNIALLNQVLDPKEGPITKFCVASTFIDIMANSEAMRLARNNPVEVPAHLAKICLKYPVATNQTLTESLGIKVTQVGMSLTVSCDGNDIAKVEEDEVGSGLDLLNTALVAYARSCTTDQSAKTWSAVDMTARAARINAAAPYTTPDGDHYQHYCDNIDGTSSALDDMPPSHEVEDDEGEMDANKVDDAPNVFMPPEGRLKVKEMKALAQMALDSGKKIYFHKASHVFADTDPLVSDAVKRNIPYALIRGGEDKRDVVGILMGDISGGITPLAPGPESVKAFRELVTALENSGAKFKLQEQPKSRDRTHQAPARSAYMAEDAVVPVSDDMLKGQYGDMYADTIDILRADNDRRPDPASLNQKYEEYGWGHARQVVAGKNGETYWVGNPLLTARGDLPRSLKTDIGDLKKKLVVYRYTLRQAIAKIAEFIENHVKLQNYAPKPGAELDPIALAMNTMAKNYNGWMVEQADDGEYVFVGDHAVAKVPRANAARKYPSRM